MSKKINTSNALIEINKQDEENIVKGLALLINLYADGLKDLCYDAKIHGNLLECELVGIEDHIKRLQSVSNTINYFYERGSRDE